MPDLLASIIITTYDRRSALLETLAALDRQTTPPDHYEIVVVDNGSTDGTYEALQALALACPMITVRVDTNRGISGGRNVAIRLAKGEALILLSDDVVVPEDFVARHLAALQSHPGFWVVGGFRQLPSLRATPFGRYLDELETGFTELRKLSPLGDGVWELGVPTARNLSLPRVDLERIGLFDERFRSSCEDQDLAHRAREVGIRFLYDEAITCLHNDQAGDLVRCCAAQRRGTHDTVLLCRKYPDAHAGNPLERAHGPLSWRDPPSRTALKLARSVLSRDLPLGVLHALVRVAEKLGAPEGLLRRLYRILIGLNVFRGWREGLRSASSGAAR
jgi:glycosyltransferase involved in cell wall biosynthesis